jgi:hypothetical protein
MQREVHILLRRLAWRMLWTRAAEWAAVGATVGALAAATLMLVRAALPPLVVSLPPLWFFSAVLLPCGALVGVLAALLRGVGVREAAVFVDLRYGLQERLATAAELSAGGRDDPAARCVFEQALAGVGSLQGRVRFRTRTRRTPAALLLGAMLCAALLLLPQRRANDETAQLARQVAALRADQRRALAQALREEATRREIGEEKSLQDAAAVIELSDERELRRVLAALKKRGVHLREIAPPALREKLGFPVEGTADQGSARVQRQEPGPGEAFAFPGETTAGGEGVYHPAYADIVPPGEESAGFVATTPAEAWRMAQDRAALALHHGDVPAEYRPIVRAFFDIPPDAAP